MLFTGKLKFGDTADAEFQLQINKNGSYSILFNKVTWLTSAPTFFYVGGKKYSLADQSLKINQSVQLSGYDNLGRWQKTCWPFVIINNHVTTCFKTYTTPALPFVIFEQQYLNATNGTSTGDNNSVIAGFPSFQMPQDEGQLGFMHFAGSMAGDTSKSFGRWNNKAKLRTGIIGGPLVLFDSGENVLVISPFNQFMAASSYSDGHSYSYGVMGGVDYVPANFVLQTVLMYRSAGINRAMDDWGRLMTTYYGKDGTYRQSDLTLNYIGYWTDGGAYYYYNVETNKDYEQTILDCVQYGRDINMPYRYLQIDSYFYFKGPNGGVQTWTPMPLLFPHGFQYLYNMTGLPIGCHNRWWSPNNTYAKQNGGQFDFIVEKAKAVPTDESFWNYLFDNAKRWGLILYEQDWLDVEFAGVNALLTQIDLGRTWLMQMGKAARNNDLTIQYCMSNPRHILQSLEIPVVTQARASGDYRAGGDNWKIGISSIFTDAVGVAPFKDNFWSSADQPGNPKYPDLKETHAELQAAVATLSTGPVGPGDMINKTNATLVMQCCRYDGMILQTSRPAKAIDAQIKQMALGGNVGPRGEVWTTYTNIGDFVFGLVLGTAMDADYSLSPTTAGFNFFGPSNIFTRSTTSRPINQPFSDSQPLKITTACSRSEICLYYTSPVFSPGGKNVLIYGEEGKFVAMSGKRVRDITVDADDLLITVIGGVNEQIKFGFIEADQYISISCNLGATGSATISFMAQSCSGL
ncbi:hypothetical protein SNE40_001362 [Patella caerulea]|uniref:Uncharacterized protein n=1 Tax=Patella caerulea TaxID=87958 RepID=A0AAN8KMV8_PATCE